MDIGAFIHGLEYASNSQAMMIGKPSVDFFNIALADMQLSTSEVLMIGDDIDSDIGGAQQINILGFLELHHLVLGKQCKQRVQL